MACLAASDSTYSAADTVEAAPADQDGSAGGDELSWHKMRPPDQSTAEPKEVPSPACVGCGFLSPVSWFFEDGPQKREPVKVEPPALASDGARSSASTASAANVEERLAGGRSSSSTRGNAIATTAGRARKLYRAGALHADLEAKRAELEIERIDWEIVHVEQQIQRIMLGSSTEEGELSHGSYSYGLESEIGTEGDSVMGVGCCINAY